MDLTAAAARAAAGIRATRKSLLWALQDSDGAAGGHGPELPSGKRTERPRDLPGAGRRISPMHGTRSCLQVDEALAGYVFDHCDSFYVRHPVSG